MPDATVQTSSSRSSSSSGAGGSFARRREAGPGISLAGLAALVLAAVLCSWPLARWMDRGVPIGIAHLRTCEVARLEPGDALQLLYRMWLFKNAVHGEIEFWSDPYQFGWPGHPPRFDHQEFPLSAPFALLSDLFGDCMGYNLLLWASFAVLGGGFYLLARLYGAAPWAAWVGGLLLAVAPFRLEQTLGGHANGFLAGAVPIFLWGVERFLDDARPGPRWLALCTAGVCLLVLTALEPHLLLYLATFCGLYAPFQAVRFLIRNGADRRRIVARLGTPVKLFLGLLPWLVIAAIYVWLRQQRLEASVMGGGRDPRERLLYSPSLRDLFVRNPLGEHLVYLGPLTSLVAALGLGVWLLMSWRHIAELREQRRFFLTSWGPLVIGLFGVFAALAALGPNGPLHPLLDRIPFYRYSRVPGRITLFSSLAIALGMALGLTLLGAAACRKDKWRLAARIGAAAAILGAVSEYRPPGHTIISLLPAGNSAFREAASATRDRGGTLLCLPIWPGDSVFSSVYMHFVSQHPVRVLNGYSPAVRRDYVTNVFEKLAPLNRGYLDGDLADQLEQLAVSWCTLHVESFTAPRWVSRYPWHFTWSALRTHPMLHERGAEDTVFAFQLRERAERDAVDPAELATWRAGLHSPYSYVFEGERFAVEGAQSITWPGAASNGAVVLATAVAEGDLEPPFPRRLLDTGTQTFPMGEYVLDTQVTGWSGAEGALTLRVVGGQGRSIWEADLAQLDPVDVPGLARLGLARRRGRFVLERPERLGFAATLPAPSSTGVDIIELRLKGTGSAAPAPPGEVFEAEGLFARGQPRLDPAASGGLVMELDPRWVEPGRVTAGPFRLAGPGRVHASARFRTVLGAAPPEGAAVGAFVLWAEEMGGNGQRELARAQVTIPPGSDTEGTRSWEVPVEAELDGSCVLGCSLDYAGRVPVALDSWRLAGALNP